MKTLSPGTRKNRGNVPIREWIEEERPREMLLCSGAESLPLAKLLSIILRTGRRGESAEELSRTMLNAFSGLRGMDAASVVEMRGIKGIGPAKAAQIKAAFEIGKRLCREKAKRRERIENARNAVDYVAAYYGPYLRDARCEFLCAIMLDCRNRPIRAVEISKGGPGHVSADPRQIVREAVSLAASSILLVHNHPSGDGEPSADDVSFTAAVGDACQLFGIRLLDHVIVGRDRRDYYSFARTRLLRGRG
jgi:DNA repair protein RadC